MRSNTDLRSDLAQKSTFRDQIPVDCARDVCELACRRTIGWLGASKAQTHQIYPLNGSYVTHASDQDWYRIDPPCNDIIIRFLRVRPRQIKRKAATGDPDIKRKKLSGDLELVALDPFSIRAEFSREEQDGTRPFFGSFGLNNALEIFEPFSGFS